MKIVTRGAGSIIARALGEIEGVEIEAVRRDDPLPFDRDLYLFAQGWHNQAPLREDAFKTKTMEINAWWPMREIDHLIEHNPLARIVVIGSDSGYKWSFVGAYAAAKAAIHKYIETKRLKFPDQQLVCIAPSMIAGSGMVERRNEAGRNALLDRLTGHPKERMVSADEIAHLIHYLLGPYGSFVSGVVIRMNGGEHCGDRW